MKRVSDFAVLVAQVAIGYIYFSFAGPWSENIVLLAIGFALIGVGVVCGLRALYDLRKSFAVAPKPLEGCEFVTSGIYSYIRHPMYSGLILVAAGLLVSRYGTNLLVMFGFVILYLLAKIYIEEKLLNQCFNQYREYSKKTGRIFPKFSH